MPKYGCISDGTPMRHVSSPVPTSNSWSPKSNKCSSRLKTAKMDQNSLTDTGDSKRAKRNTRSQAKKAKHEEEEQFEVVHFLPNGEGQLKDIPGIGQVLETKENEGTKVLRYPISALGKPFYYVFLPKLCLLLHIKIPNP